MDSAGLAFGFRHVIEFGYVGDGITRDEGVLRDLQFSQFGRVEKKRVNRGGCQLR